MTSFLLALMLIANAEPIRIAVIDTGINLSTSNVKLCKEGSKDLTGKGFSGPEGHGHNVAHIIGDNLQNVEYCLYIIKFYHEYADQSAMENALNYALSLNPDFINISAGGPGFILEEYTIIQNILRKNITIIAAGGNKNNNLDKVCNYFPACYDDRIMAVGSIDDQNNKSKFSNYGNYIKIWQKGEKVSAGGYTFSGTSQATAKATALLARKLYETKRYSK